MELFGHIQGREVPICIEAKDAQHYVVEIEGDRYEVDCTEPSANLYSILLGNMSYEVRVSERDRKGTTETHIFQDRYEVTIEDPLKRMLRESQAAASKGEAVVESVMHGKVLRILVKEGDTVEEGQPLLVLVAMKMENELESPKAGVVKKICVNENDSVETGAHLLVVG